MIQKYLEKQTHQTKIIITAVVCSVVGFAWYAIGVRAGEFIDPLWPLLAIAGIVVYIYPFKTTIE